MAVQFLNNIDLKGNQILNGRFQVLSSDPTSPNTGDFYYNDPLLADIKSRSARFSGIFGERRYAAIPLLLDNRRAFKLSGQCTDVSYFF